MYNEMDNWKVKHKIKGNVLRKGKIISTTGRDIERDTIDRNSGQSIFDERKLLLDNKYLLSVYNPQKFSREECVVRQVVVK